MLYRPTNKAKKTITTVVREFSALKIVNTKDISGIRAVPTAISIVSLSKSELEWSDHLRREFRASPSESKVRRRVAMLVKINSDDTGVNSQPLALQL